MKKTEDRPKPVPRPNLVIGVGPIRFPEYLDRPQMVRRLDDNRVELAEYDRWAEPLAENFQRVLCENLATLLGTPNIEKTPFRPEVAIDLRVAIEVLRFDVTADGSTNLVARYALTRSTESPVSRWVQFEREVPADPHSANSAAARLSESLSAFSARLAEAVVADGFTCP